MYGVHFGYFDMDASYSKPCMETLNFSSLVDYVKHNHGLFLVAYYGGVLVTN